MLAQFPWGLSFPFSKTNAGVVGTPRPASVGYPSLFVLHPGSTERFGSLMFVKLSKISPEALQSLILTFPGAALGNGCHPDYSQSLESRILSMILKASSPAQCSWLDLQCYLNLPCHVPASLQSLLFWMKYGPAWPVVNKGSSVKSISAPLLTQVGRVEARSHTSINQGWVSLCSSGMVCEEGSRALQ